VGSIVSWRACANAVFAFAAVVAFTAIVLTRPPNDAAAQLDETVVYKTPPAANLFLGGAPLVIEERVQGVPTDGLGAFQIRVTYNQKWVDVSVTEGPFIGSTGREVACVTYPAVGQVTFACLSVGPQAAPSGEGVLAYVTVAPRPELQWRPVPNAFVEVNIHDVASATVLADPLGTPYFIDAVSDSRLYVRALISDVVPSCAVDNGDLDAIAGRYGATIGSQLYSPLFDVEPPAAPDGDIDVLDLAVVASHLGSTCETPHPAQPPPAPLCADIDNDGQCEKTDPDDDNDGMPDKFEAGFSCLDPMLADSTFDQDGDSLLTDTEAGLGTSPCLADTDGDALGDAYEVASPCLNALVADGNGDPDTDSLDNVAESGAGTDPCDDDSDDDGLLDGAEVQALTDPLDEDTDADGLLDGVEVNSTSTDPLDPDSDDDEITDGEEVNSTGTDPADSDTDDDGLLDGPEVTTTGTDPLDSDSDDDQLSDGEEVLTASTDPLDPDTDDDGLLDGLEVTVYTTSPLSADTDSDLMPDPYEVERIPCGFNPVAHDAGADADTDQLGNLAEIGLGTDPCMADTDSDECRDGQELHSEPGSQATGGRRDPLNPWDYFNPTQDGKNRVDDILAVLEQYYVDVGSASYTPETDRLLVGPQKWNLGAPNGLQRIDDILNILSQYHHDCAT
jgi:hypothetical protein